LGAAAPSVLRKVVPINAAAIATASSALDVVLYIVFLPFQGRQKIRSEEVGSTRATTKARLDTAKCIDRACLIFGLPITGMTID
jgi:hypothetical protein